MILKVYKNKYHYLLIVDELRYDNKYKTYFSTVYIIFSRDDYENIVDMMTSDKGRVIVTKLIKGKFQVMERQALKLEV